MVLRRLGWLLFALGCSRAPDPLVAVDAALDTPLAELDAEADVEPEAGVDAEAEAEADAESDADAEGAVDAAVDADAFPPSTFAPVCAPGTDAGCTATRVRVMAANLSSGSSLSYEGPGIRIMQGLHPDLVLIQEFKYPGGPRALVDATFGPGFSYAIETELGAIPNGIISRYPILESGEWDDPDVLDRDFVWARIDVPGPTDLYAVSVHLRTTSGTARDTAAKLLVELIKAKVPTSAYLVVGGDLNTTIETELALSTLSAVVVTSAPYAVDQAANNKTNAPRNRPYDWVLPGASLFGRMIPVRIGASEYPSGLVVDTRVYAPIGDLAPALSTDSAASNMQHMAVVRDFALE